MWFVRDRMLWTSLLRAGFASGSPRVYSPGDLCNANGVAHPSTRARMPAVETAGYLYKANSKLAGHVQAGLLFGSVRHLGRIAPSQACPEVPPSSVEGLSKGP
jgi:hypothetical protein